MITKTRTRGQRTEDLKADFFLIMKEVLSSAGEISHGVNMIADKKNILNNSQEQRSRLIDAIIKERARISKGVGIVANAPSAIPIVGTIGTTAFTSALEFISLIRLQIEMCLEIAYVNGKDPDEDRIMEALAIIGWKHDRKDGEKLKKSAMRTGIKRMIKSYMKKGIILMTERIVTRIQLASLRRSLSRFVPLLGMPIAARINYSDTISVGRLAEIYYE